MNNFQRGYLWANAEEKFCQEYGIYFEDATIDKSTLQLEISPSDLPLLDARLYSYDLDKLTCTGHFIPETVTKGDLLMVIRKDDQEIGKLVGTYNMNGGSVLKWDLDLIIL